MKLFKVKNIALIMKGFQRENIGTSWVGLFGIHWSDDLKMRKWNSRKLIVDFRKCNYAAVVSGGICLTVFYQFNIVELS